VELSNLVWNGVLLCFEADNPCSHFLGDCFRFEFDFGDLEVELMAGTLANL
jgi:hypothetical protein